MCKLDKVYNTKVHFLVEWLNNCFSSNSATSAPVECLFSIAGKVFRTERCSFKDYTCEKFNMMIKCNHSKLNVSDNNLKVADYAKGCSCVTDNFILHTL